MFDLAMEILGVTIGAFAGVMAIFITVVTIRTFRTGTEAYEVNRKAMSSNLKGTLTGQIGKGSDGENRCSHGLAINLTTGELIAQKRLSTEAVDDVIGRRV